MDDKFERSIYLRFRPPTFRRMSLFPFPPFGAFFPLLFTPFLPFTDLAGFALKDNIF